MVQANTTSCRLAHGMHALTALALSAEVTGELESQVSTTISILGLFRHIFDIQNYQFFTFVSINF